jgi:hypothetical protein
MAGSWNQGTPAALSGRSSHRGILQPQFWLGGSTMSFRGAMLVGVCLAALLPASAAAAEEAVKVKAADKAACMPDAMRLCRDAVPNVRNVLACFSKNRGKLSGRCNAVLASYGL